MKKAKRVLLILLLSLGGLLLLLSVVFALSNLGLPRQSPVLETLSEPDKIRLAEVVHLLQTEGDDVWPGWGQANAPAIAYNESYAFLVAYPDPPDGWVKVPAGVERGGPWELVPDDAFIGQPYYRQALPDPDISPEGFTVLVGERWVYSLQTLDWAKISLIDLIRQDLPSFLRPVFPYRLYVGQLIDGSDKYISLVAHEAFHAFQGTSSPEKLADAERAIQNFGSLYPWDDPSLQVDWHTEMDLLVEALRSTDHDQTLDLTRRFLNQRASRRDSNNLSQDLIAYEKQREWLEGLGRYAELEIWRQAISGNYAPLAETSSLADFNGYAAFDSRWKQELSQIDLMADDEGDGRFYYSGMAQAFLLDRLLPDWKLKAFDGGSWLDDLLEEGMLNQ